MAVTVRFVVLAVALALASACSATGNPAVAAGSGPSTTAAAAPTTATTSGASATTAAPALAPTTLATTAPPAARVRSVSEQDWTPFAAVGGITLHHPSRRVEHVGFHQSNHDGARQLEPLPTAVAPIVLESRDRNTGSHSAADLVADPSVEIRSPVTGTVKRGGTYVLYCDNTDHFVVISPDARPEWEVKLLHMVGLQVGVGERVVAGETVIAAGPRQLPFESQVDEARTADPAWPHVHVEVVDPSIPNRPSPGEGGGC